MESVAFSEDAERARKLRDPTAEAKDMIDRLEYFINDMERKTFDMHLVEDYRMGFSLKYVKEFAQEIKERHEKGEVGEYQRKIEEHYLELAERYEYILSRGDLDPLYLKDGARMGPVNLSGYEKTQSGATTNMRDNYRMKQALISKQL
mmetsp:Transcript_35329/g.31773  ORF Transcript_35329/g.31773 Transcript_35329/m.31773 type:complete len:148 (-) Transcript_35329:206-649(-)